MKTETTLTQRNLEEFIDITNKGTKMVVIKHMILHPGYLLIEIYIVSAVWFN